MICYKFTTAQYAFWTLFDKRMKASRPKEFNDPFEFCPDSDPDSFLPWIMSNPELALGLYDIARQKNYNGTFDDFKAGDFRKIPPENFQGSLEKWDLKAREQASKYVGIICLSYCSPVSRRSPVYLLWSHYADSLKGCVIGVNVWHECFRRARLNSRVNYVRERPKYAWNLESQANLKQYLEISKTKSDVWANEREYRLAFPLEELEQLGGHYFVPIDPQAVRRVIYGEFIDDVFKNRIKRILDHPDFSHVRRFQIQRDPHKYSLRLVRVG